MAGTITILGDDETVVVREDQEGSVDVDEQGSLPNLDYRSLANKPSINEEMLVGDKSLKDIGVGRITNSDIRDIIGRRRR